jgi:hypothetical protein
MHGFHDGGRRMIIRFTPTDAGDWDFRITSNVAAFNGKTGRFSATDSGSDGFLRVDNVRAWSTTQTRKAHLWMGDTCYRFAWIDRSLFDRVIDARAQQKFNHLRGLLMHNDERLRRAFHDPDTPNFEHFRELDGRIRAANQKGLFVDLVLAGDQNHLAEVFRTWQQRERLIRYVASRYSPYMITWQGVQEFEEYADGRALLKEIGDLLKKFDPYGHPRTTHAVTTSGPLLSDSWMTHVLYQSSDNAVGSIEKQLFAAPLVNAEFAYENSGAGATHPHHVDSDTFRRRLWHATMNGQYPYFGNTGTYGGRGIEIDAKYLDSPGAKAMTAWFDFFSRTRHWELEPYFEVDGGRALALPGVEYIVYVEKAGPVELVTERQTYDIYWFNPATGELSKQKKDWKGERFSASPPSSSGDWVLHLSRDGRKESMLRSYKFESRRVLFQEVERSPERAPFTLVKPAADVLPVSTPLEFEAKLTRETRASGSMLYLWTAEATGDNQGYRVIGSGATGKFTIPKSIAKKYPAVVNLRLYGINANGKVYAIDRVVRAE